MQDFCETAAEIGYPRNYVFGANITGCWRIADAMHVGIRRHLTHNAGSFPAPAHSLDLDQGQRAPYPSKLLNN